MIKVLEVFPIAGLAATAACCWAVLAATPSQAGDAVQARGLGLREARIFGQVCAQCHLRPGIGVPLLGDAAAWEARRAKGFEVLVANTVVGFGDMPPLGTCSHCTESELRQLVAYLVGGDTPAQAGAVKEGAP